jgi:hypothetical protein
MQSGKIEKWRCGHDAECLFNNRTCGACVHRSGPLLPAVPAIGLALFSLLFLLEGPVMYVGLLGLIPIATAIFKYCPISHMLHVNTCSTKPIQHG